MIVRYILALVLHSLDPSSSTQCNACLVIVGIRWFIGGSSLSSGMVGVGSLRSWMGWSLTMREGRFEDGGGSSFWVFSEM